MLKINHHAQHVQPHLMPIILTVISSCGPTGLEIAIRDALDIMAMGFSQKFQNQVVKLLVINYH